jgi:hypothetical protein
MARGKIFINYRRDDSRADAGRLYDRLVMRFPGEVFRDVTSLEPGVEWHEAIARVLAEADACIVVIGKDWLKISDATGRRRLDDPRDTVRQELVTALGRKMRVFPVLVGGAKMPQEEDFRPIFNPYAAGTRWKSPNRIGTRASTSSRRCSHRRSDCSGRDWIVISARREGLGCLPVSEAWLGLLFWPRTL